MTPTEQKIAVKLGPLLKQYRKSKKIRQAQLASQMGVSQSFVSKIEKGQLIPSAPWYFQFCQITKMRRTLLEELMQDQTSTQEGT